MNEALEILIRSDGMIAIDKPAGLVSTGRDLDDPDCAQAALGNLVGRPVWAVHQLDRDTSGVNIFVERKSLVAPWQERLRTGTKTYVAVVRGRCVGARRVTEPIGFSRRRRRWAVQPDGKPALTLVDPVWSSPRASVVTATIGTGRTHQIRVHMSHLGHPLLGEQRYCRPPCSRHERHALHAWQVSLGELAIVAPWPTDLVTLVERLGGHLPTSDSEA